MGYLLNFIPCVYLSVCACVMRRNARNVFPWLLLKRPPSRSDGQKKTGGGGWMDEGRGGL